jgi:uncharacterized membrane protein
LCATLNHALQAPGLCNRSARSRKKSGAHDLKVEIRNQKAAVSYELSPKAAFLWSAVARYRLLPPEAKIARRRQALLLIAESSSVYNALLMTSARGVLAGVFGFICALVIAAPVLAHSSVSAAAIVYLFFSPICHQIPERSFALLGHPMAVCHRCSGIYLGLFLGSLIENNFMHRSTRIRRIWVLSAMTPLLLDLMLPLTGIWAGTYLIRFFTGLIFGMTAAWLVVRGAAELLNEQNPWQRLLCAIRIREAFHE